MNENLKKIRETLGFSPDEFRAQLGIDNQPTYYRYENGDRKIPDSVVLALFVKFNVNLNYLFMGELPMFLHEEIKPIHLPNRALEVEAMTLNEGKNLYLIQKFNGYSDEKMSEILLMSLEEYLEITNGNKKMQLKHYDAVKANFDVSINDLRYDEKGLFKKLDEKLDKQKQSFESMSAAQREEFMKFLQNKKG